MSKKSIAWEDALNDILSDPEVNAIYEAELRAERVREQLLAWRCMRYKKTLCYKLGILSPPCKSEPPW